MCLARRRRGIWFEPLHRVRVRFDATLAIGDYTLVVFARSP